MSTFIVLYPFLLSSKEIFAPIIPDPIIVTSVECSIDIYLYLKKIGQDIQERSLSGERSEGLTPNAVTSSGNSCFKTSAAATLERAGEV